MIKSDCLWMWSHLLCALFTQYLCKCTVKFMSVCVCVSCPCDWVLVTYCVWLYVVGNNPPLTQHQMIVSEHFIKRKSVAFTSAEPVGLRRECRKKNGLTQGDTDFFREKCEQLWKSLCKSCQVDSNQDPDEIITHCTSNLYCSAHAGCGFHQNINTLDLKEKRGRTYAGHLHLSFRSLLCFCADLLNQKAK